MLKHYAIIIIEREVMSMIKQIYYNFLCSLKYDLISWLAKVNEKLDKMDNE